jgi:hypothetical protein
MRNKYIYVRSEFFTAVTMKNTVHWNAAPLCNLTFRRNVLPPSWLQPHIHAGFSPAYFSTLKMEAIRSSETSDHTRSIWRHIPEDDILLNIFERNFQSLINSRSFKTIVWALTRSSVRGFITAKIYKIVYTLHGLFSVPLFYAMRDAYRLPSVGRSSKPQSFIWVMYVTILISPSSLKLNGIPSFQHRTLLRWRRNHQLSL